MKAMVRALLLVLVLLLVLSALTLTSRLGAQTPATASSQNEVTFTKDVAPIVQQHCQECHRSNGIAPMPLLTYEDARPWAKAMKQRVAAHIMPPWFIDPNVGITDFKNFWVLSENDIETIVN